MLNNPWFEIIPVLGVTAIDHLFNRLDGMYTGKWRQSFTHPNSIGNWRNAWAEALHARHITPQQVKRGLANCSEMYAWPPSLTEFIKACEMPSRDEPAQSTFKALPNDSKFLSKAEMKNGFAALKKAVLESQGVAA
ncbi:replication protein P [Pelistega sp. MC2]|uniref:replication protein P n=1 Tax=Pelistega sp. MC2 TaxID=1720297 RepID=UPI0008DA15B6|nr:replication protein P [Pelistega sp. MC2]